MTKIARWRLALSALAIGLAVSGAGFPVALAQTAEPADEIRFVAIDKIPWDATAVITASVLAIRGRDMPQDSSPVILTQAAKAALSDPSFRYEGLTLAGFVLTKYGASSAFANAVTMSAILRFLDDDGRRASVALLAEYGAVTTGIEIKEATVITLPPSKPEVRLFVVPATAFLDGVFPPELDWSQLARLVADKTLPLDRPERLSKSPQSYYVVAFVMERLPPDAEFQLRVSETPEGIEGDHSFSVTKDFDGWRVATMRGKFTLNSETEFFIKAIYTPGIPLPAAERTPRLVGSLSSYLK